MSVCQHVGQMLNGMQRGDARVMLDLLSATETGYGDPTVATLSNRREQPFLADCSRDVVVFFLVPERAGHPTTAAVDFLGDEPRWCVQ